MIKFGINAVEIEAAASAIGRALDVQFRPHESDSHGGPYCRAEVPEGTLLLQRNTDVLDDEPFETSWPANKVLLCFDGPNDEAWQPYVNALCALHDPGIKQLAGDVMLE